MHYFPTKEHLLIGVLEHRDEVDAANMVRLAEREPGLTLLDVLAAHMAHNIEEQPALATLYSVIMAESIDPDHVAHDWFAERNRRTRELLVAALAQAQERGEVRRDLEPADMAAQILAMYDGLALQWSLDPDRVDAVAAMRGFLQALRA
jgi:AcrR family transcriptional regulator